VINRFLIHLFFVAGLVSFLITGCNQAEYQSNPFYNSTKPGVRWWWFATEIKKEDIRHQLNWAKEHQFGGVEIAWVYPLYRYQRMYKKNYNRHYPKDTSAAAWLSPEWTEAVVFTKQYCDSIGLYCDFTFGSAWPVAGGNIDPAHSTQIYGDSAFRQKLTFSWAWPEEWLVINHLDSEAFHLFSEPIAKAIQPALKGSKSALFTDSWEIKMNGTNKIWTPGFDTAFQNRFGYDIIPYMEQGLDSFQDVRYDYMMLLDEYVTNGFYKSYVETCRELGAWSRVQCLASPTDVMTTYSLVDIPETEAMLNNPNYSRIVSSSAALSGKQITSSETFTCMYGFPSTYLREEQTADLKMVADALFAQGVNHHFYHGMPYNPKGSDTIEFFATTYFGPGSALEEELAEFNSYIATVSSYLQKGRTYSDVAVYIPYEDGVMKGAYPPERQRVWVWGEYELRYVYPPQELSGFHPLWINRHFLENATLENNVLHVGDALFRSLYVDVNYLDIRALERIWELAKRGFPICMKQIPEQPGKVRTNRYATLLDSLSSRKNVSPYFTAIHPGVPIITGDSLPEYWCRVTEDGTGYLFLAQWPAKGLEYPVYSGQSYTEQSTTTTFSIQWAGKVQTINVEFKPYQSVLLKLSPTGAITQEDIEFIPKDPEVRPREEQKMYF
jgi:hypothetical protein